MESWKEILGWNKDQVSDIRFVAYSYLRQGKYDIARKFFESLTLLEPQSAYDHRTLGAIYLQQEEYEKALKSLDRGLDLEPNHDLSLLNKARALINLGRKKEGLDLAKTLKKHKNPFISDRSCALIMAWK